MKSSGWPRWFGRCRRSAPRPQIDHVPGWNRCSPLRMLARMPKSPQPPAEIAATILVVRGQRVLLDADLAERYGVSTRRLNEQVRRNLQRFPEDFLIDPTNQDLASLKSHYGEGSRNSVDAVRRNGSLVNWALRRAAVGGELAGVGRRRHRISTKCQVSRGSPAGHPPIGCSHGLPDCDSCPNIPPRNGCLVGVI